MTLKLAEIHKDILRRYSARPWPTKHEVAMVRKAPQLRGRPGHTVHTALADLLDAGFFPEPTWYQIQRTTFYRDRSPAVLTELGERERAKLEREDWR